MSNFIADDSFTYKIFHDWQDDFLGQPVDELHRFAPTNAERVKSKYFDGDWGFCYDVVQFFGDYAIIEGSGEPFSKLRAHGEAFIAMITEVLEAEKSGYRFVGGEITNIIEEVEVDALENATRAVGNFYGSKEHLKSSLRMYSDREHPDYRNSIKESISAIESAFSNINGKKSKNMAEALKLATDRGLSIPPALRSGISNIYGWTSDEEGVRHALYENEATVGADEAKFMLVMCSALLNYLKSKN